MVAEVEYSDIIKIASMIRNTDAIATDRVVSELLVHLKDKEESLALKIVLDDEIVGVWFSKEFDKHISLSFFYLDESIRKNPKGVEFFKHCYGLVNKSKPMYLVANDTKGFEKYVEKVSDNLYRFVGPR